MESNTSFNKIVQIALKILKTPVAFYQTMPKSGGFLEPMLFVIMMAIAVGLIMTLFSILGLGMHGGMVAGFGAILFTVAASIISSFIGAAILFVIWKLMGSNESYEVSYRCIAYASVVYPIVAILSPIPYIGSILSTLLGTILMIIASIEVHHVNPKTAYIVFCVLGIVAALTNISNEMVVRSMAEQTEEFASQFGDLNKMPPEEAGRALGKFFKGMEQGVQ